MCENDWERGQTSWTAVDSQGGQSAPLYRTIQAVIVSASFGLDVLLCLTHLIKTAPAPRSLFDTFRRSVFQHV